MTSSFLLRQATEADRDALDRLADLDTAKRLKGPALLAFDDDRAVAALSLTDGRVVADPFSLSAGAVELLRLRARGAPRRERTVRRLVPRLA